MDLVKRFNVVGIEDLWVQPVGEVPYSYGASLFEFVCRRTNQDDQALHRSGGSSLIAVQPTLMWSKGKQKIAAFAASPRRGHHESVRAQLLLVHTVLLARRRVILRRFVLTED